VWASPHSQFDRPVAFPEDGIRGQGKAVGTKTPPTGGLPETIVYPSFPTRMLP
jgi:hypothetical protein